MLRHIGFSFHSARQSERKSRLRQVYQPICETFAMALQPHHYVSVRCSTNQCLYMYIVSGFKGLWDAKELMLKI